MIRSFLILALMSTAAMAQTRIIPHLTRPGGDFTTNLILVNSQDSMQEYRLTPYAEDGAELEVVSGFLAAGETLNIGAEDLFPSGAASHFTITGDIYITVAYQDAQATNSSAHVGSSDTQAHRWRLYPGELDDVVDGIAVVNMDTEPRDIQVRQVSADNTEHMRITPFNQVAPNSKSLYVFQDFEKLPGAYFEIFSEGPLSITALRFATGGAGFNYFWASDTPALPALVDNQAPVITGQETLTTQAGTPLTITLDDLRVADDDNTYPDDFTLGVFDGDNYTRDGNTITPVDGFTGDLSVGVTVNDGTVDSEVYQLTVTVTEPVDPRIGQVAVLSPSQRYGISGRAVIVDERTVRLENFFYNGDGPDVRVYLALDRNFVSGKPVTEAISGTNYDNATIDITLPDDFTLDDFNSISIWCTVFSINFSAGDFQ
ncbi:MAG: DM13 domain-containing protein [Acidobacteriota bacterium]|nr:DM13 domain-containing protein [Acidobacteriota bacterium]